MIEMDIVKKIYKIYIIEIANKVIFTVNINFYIFYKLKHFTFYNINFYIFYVVTSRAIKFFRAPLPSAKELTTSIIILLYVGFDFSRKVWESHPPPPPAKERTIFYAKSVKKFEKNHFFFLIFDFENDLV